MFLEELLGYKVKCYFNRMTRRPIYIHTLAPFCTRTNWSNSNDWDTQQKYLQRKKVHTKFGRLINSVYYPIKAAAVNTEGTG